MKYPIEILDESEIDPVLDEQIREFLLAHFSDWAKIFEKQRVWHQLPPLFTVLSREEDKIIGHIAVVVRKLTTTWNHRYEVASIQGVLVDPAYRRHGLGSEMMKVALAEAKKRGLLYAILFCKEPLVEYYLHSGWKLADESMVMWNNRDLPIAMRSNCPMYIELTEIPLPEGPLDVHR